MARYTEYHCYSNRNPHAQPFVVKTSLSTAKAACDKRVADKGGEAFVMEKPFEGPCVEIYTVGEAS